MADVIFRYIKDYGFGHSSQLINDGVIKATELALPNIGPYLESRMIRALELKNTQNPIKSDRMFSADSIGDYGMITAKAWASDSKIKKEMFESKKDGVSQVTMEMHYLDVTSLF